MGRVKELLLEAQMEPARYEIIRRLGITEEEAELIDWEVITDHNDDGMIYGFYLEFSEDSDSEILKRIGADRRTLYLDQSYADEPDDEYYEYQAELIWESQSKKHFKHFRDTADDIEALLQQNVAEEQKFAFSVMIYMHTVSAIERLLQSTFLHEVSSSEEYMQRFVENDHDLKKRPILLGNIFKINHKLKEIVINRINEILFHTVTRVAGLYDKVFNLQLGDLSWLSKAVVKRHDCAHRAGHTKEGARIDLTILEIETLLNQCKELANTIDAHFREEEEDPISAHPLELEKSPVPDLPI